jgi:fluoroacetyl-CoA thioesterase
VKDTLQPGISCEHRFIVPQSKTVPALYPEADEFLAMPEVFATGFLVGLLEWTCIRAVNPHLDWPHEQTVGIRIDVSHQAATPPGLEVTVKAQLIAVEGRKLTFTVEAHDGVDLISTGRHERFVIHRETFDSKLAPKRDRARQSSAGGMAKRVLALGLDPAVVDLTPFPDLTPEMVRSFIDAQLDRLRSLGYEVSSCLTDLGDTAETMVAAHLGAESYDCVMIGAGIRAPERLLLFERLLNLIHERAPAAKLCFNTSPADSAEAVQRWILSGI